MGHGLSRKERKALARQTRQEKRDQMTETNEHKAEVVETVKVDMAVVRQIFLANHDILFAPLGKEQLVKPNTVIVGGNGLFLHKKLPLADMTMKIADLKAFPMLPTIGQSVSIHVPKLPWKNLMQIFSFFREVSKSIKTEAYVQCLWFPELDAWEIYVPKQKVTGGTVKHEGERGDRLVRGHQAVHVWDIHSHGTMGPFFSGTDDADEGRAHRFNGVVGNLNDSVPQMKVRISDGLNNFLEPAIDAMIEVPEQPMQFEMSPLDLITSKGPKLSLPGEKVPQEWHDQLDDDVPVITHVGGHHSYHGRQAQGVNGVYGSFVADTPQRGDGLGPRSQRLTDEEYREGQKRAGFDTHDHRRFAGSEDKGTRRMWGLLPPADGNRKVN